MTDGLDQRRIEALLEILSRVKAKLERGGYVSRIERDELLASINAHLAGGVRP